MTDTLEPTAWEEELPPRPRRRLVTPATLALGAIAVAAAGFVGGVLVQRGQESESGGTAGPSGGFSQRAGGGGFVAGEVESVDGRNLFVTTTDGTTVRVRVNGSTTVTRTAKSKRSAVHPGDTVVATGETGDDGTVAAAALTATAAGAATAGAMLGGGGPPGGGGMPGGGTSGGAPFSGGAP